MPRNVYRVRLNKKGEYKMRKKPYQTVEIEGKTYDDYSVTIKGIIYDASVCRETRVLNIRRDEYQGIEDIEE